jgi:hypothetical protein
LVIRNWALINGIAAGSILVSPQSLSSCNFGYYAITEDSAVLQYRSPNTPQILWLL